MMANILITGASGGVGSHLCRQLSSQHHVMPLSRREIHGSPFEPCDLVSEIPQWKPSHNENSGTVDWIVHLATSYQTADDLRMLDHLLQFAEENDIQNFLYVSSWVVHFPDRPAKATYIEMKRHCEQRLQESRIANVRIVRPSVIVGPGLSWTKILTKLSSWAWLIPSQVSRSFVSIDEVVQCLTNVIEGRNHSAVVTCLGERQPLSEKSLQASGRGAPFPRRVLLSLLCSFLLVSLLIPNANSWVVWLGGIIAIATLLIQFLPRAMGSLSDYFAGFVDRHFEPRSEQDVIALCHRDNHNIEIRGYDNARLYFQNPHPLRRTTVSLRRFNRVLKIDKKNGLVRVQSGAHFGELLPLLDAEGLWLENYPNYHFISVGASIATAVHGSNLDKPFLADLVQSLRYYDREIDQVVEVSRGDAAFSELIFDSSRPKRRIILTADLQICARQYYQLSTEYQSVESLSFADQASFADKTQHYEIRINRPNSKNAVLQSYRQVSFCELGDNENDRRLLSIKADQIGRKWNLLQKNRWMSALTSSCSRLFINYEWFFTPEEFARFWQEISRDRSRYRLYKLLIRYNRRQDDVNTRYHGTVSIDVTIFNTSKMLNRSVELFQRYRPLEHLGKYSIERYVQQRNERQSSAKQQFANEHGPQVAAH